jgi:hypothetical protein
MEENKISETEQLKKLLEKNLEYSQEIYRLTKKIKNYITFQKVMSGFYFLIIVVPIILSLIFLPPLLKDLYNQYKNILGMPVDTTNQINGTLKTGGGTFNLNNIDINKLPPQVKALLNSK